MADLTYYWQGILIGMISSGEETTSRESKGRERQTQSLILLGTSLYIAFSLGESKHGVEMARNPQLILFLAQMN
jgi:hypothetical protein